MAATGRPKKTEPSLKTTSDSQVKLGNQNGNDIMEKRDFIPIPSHHRCLELMEIHAMLPNIREHSFRVMQVACVLGEALTEAGFDLHLPLVTVGALLHDLGKTPCLGTLENHAELGAGILEELGYPQVAQIVREHVHLDGAILDPRPLREAELVNYADKRVLHDAVVTLEARFADLMVRYGRTPEALARIQATAVRSRGPGGKTLCTVAPDSPGSTPGQWQQRERSAVRTLRQTDQNRL